MANLGETLRQARAHKGVTLKEAEQATRINRGHLAALEDENFRALPPLIYQRGIVRNYAMYLDLDPSRILPLFEDARGDDLDTSSHGVEAVPPINMPTHWAPNFAIIAFSVVLSAIVFAWTYSAFVQPSGEEGESTQIVATVTPYASGIAMPTEPPATPMPTQEPSPTVMVTPTVTSEERVDTGRTLPTPASDQDTEDGSDNQLQGALESQLPAGNAIEQSDQPEQEESASNVARDGVYITSIKVNALDTISLSIVADGVEVFQGTLEPGEETAFYDGSMFEVMTSSGVNTMFTNACGVEFQMGYEQGEVVYSMPADEDSCAPVGD